MNIEITFLKKGVAHKRFVYVIIYFAGTSFTGTSIKNMELQYKFILSKKN